MFFLDFSLFLWFLGNISSYGFSQNFGALAPKFFWYLLHKNRFPALKKGAYDPKTAIICLYFFCILSFSCTANHWNFVDQQNHWNSIDQ